MAEKQVSNKRVVVRETKLGSVAGLDVFVGSQIQRHTEEQRSLRKSEKDQTLQ